MVSYRFFGSLFLFFALANTAALFAQEKLSERVLADHSAIVVNRLDGVEANLNRLAKDLGHGALAKSFLKPYLDSDGTGIDRDAGGILYGDAIEYRLNDLKLVESIFEEEANPKNAASIWRPIEMNSFFDGASSLAHLSNRDLSGRIIGDRLIARALVSEDDLDWLVTGDKKLAAKMDQVSHDIINKSGTTVVADKKDVNLGWLFDEKDFVDENNFQTLTKTERKWVQELASRSEDVEYGLTSIKYHDRVLELRGHVKLTEGVLLDDLFDIDAAEKPWDVGLGFEKQGLAGVVALNMRTFRSPTAARAVPKIVFNEFYHSNATRFLNGNMLQLLTEFVGDSWNDLSAARLGVYENDIDKKIGQLAVVAVVDAKDPQQVVAELKKISALSMPADRNAEAEAARRRAIDDLIEDLKSDSVAIYSRAETRLKLGGEVALKAIKAALPSFEESIVYRAKRVIVGIERIQESRKGKPAVLDPQFWTTLNPQFEFKNAEKTADGFDAFVIEISPDPSKSAAEVQQASEVMKGLFGPQWNTIPVIQVEDHFVFMIGSNQDKLNKICRNVKAQRDDLLNHLKGVGHGSQTGQLQVIFNPERLDRLFGVSRQAGWTLDNVERVADDNKVCWIGVNLGNNSFGAEALLPIEQFDCFFRVLTK